MRRTSDHYTTRAKSEGFPARSVYKLEEIQRRFSILSAGMRVLEIGSSPGSWTLYTAKIVGPAGSIIAIDLTDDRQPINGIEFFEFIQGDIHDQKFRDTISAHAPYDCILSDAAPATSGNRIADTLRSAAIAERVRDLANKDLRHGGNLLVKIFQGSSQQEYLESLRDRFSLARQCKPKASRKSSFEVYCVGLGFRESSGQG